MNKLIEFGPLLFGLGFVAPLIAQTMDVMGLTAPLGLTNIALGLLLGVTLGLVATFRGRWL